MQTPHIHWESSRADWNFWRTSFLVYPACGRQGSLDYPSMYGSLWSLQLSSSLYSVCSCRRLRCCFQLRREKRPLDTAKHAERSHKSILHHSMQRFLIHIHYLQLCCIIKWLSQQFHARLFAVRSWCVISGLVWMSSMLPHLKEIILHHWAPKYESTSTSLPRVVPYGAQISNYCKSPWIICPSISGSTTGCYLVLEDERVH